MPLKRGTGLVVFCVAAILLGNGAALAQIQTEAAMSIENEYARYVIGADGANLRFVDRRTGQDYCAQTPRSPFARVRKEGKEFGASAATFADGLLTAKFRDSGVTATIKVTAERHYFVFEVVSVSGDGVEELVFVDIPLTLKGQLDEPFAASALALNLKTSVAGIPGRSSRLRAACYPRFGFTGAKVALVACPPSEMRKVMQDVVTAAPDLPKSPIGGPWALDSANNYGSYLFNSGGFSEDKVDDWIRLCQRLGVTQIDFHGGTSFRFGDCEPNPKVYPAGKASFKAVIDKLHAAGILAGLHTYSQFMAKSCPWVTPVPDPRLGKDATFTLAEPLTPEAVAVQVEESTEKMSTITGFFVRNSVTLQVDDELITYADVSKEPPYGFKSCKRGAYGTKAAAHAKGAKAHHLRECFGLFVPDGDSTLYEEVAAKTAEMFNECGFDFIYLDALDGSDAVAGRENAWHYSSKFVFEIWKRLKRPAIAEASTFPHHFWYVRARTGAWDHPTRSHKKFIDIHVKANEACQRMFLPAHLGWWAFKTWSGPQGEPTFADDIEYLCAKCIGTNSGLSIMGITPDNFWQVPALPRLAAVMARYENLRNANYFTDAVKERLRAPDEDYALTQSADGEWQFRQARYDKHKVVGLDGWSDAWKVTNKFGRQPLQLRIEALMSAGPYDAPGNVTLADFSDAKALPERASQPGITARLEASAAQVKVGPVSGCYTASNAMTTAQRSWSRVGKKFSPPLNLSSHQALGVWVHGDGKGEVLNLQAQSPSHLSRADGAHYILVDFTGWRYFELLEQEGERHADYSWPYGGGYATYRESVRHASIETLNLYLNNIPPKGNVTCYLSPVRALPTVKAKWRNPAVTVGGKTIVFPVEMESGCYLEFRSAADCRLYGPKGELLADVKPQGDAPTVEPGENSVKFTCESQPGVNPRAYVSVITEGEVLRGRNPDEKIKWEFLRRESDDPRTVQALDGAQNVWETVCRADAKLELEIAVESVGEPGWAYDSPTAIPLETFDSLDAFADGPPNEYLKYVVSGALKGVATSPG
ncbi:MAG: hypothetical protein FJ279_14060, partial [Planctomycetes bacterium]|nr:hypothetical protein [Planctomycetota bacterium]